MSLHVAIVGHVAGADVQRHLDPAQQPVPTGYTGAPLIGVLIGELLKLGMRVTAVTTDAQLPLDREPVRLTGPAFEFIVCPARRRAWRPNQVHTGRLGAWRLGRAVDAFATERHAVAEVLRGLSPDVVHAHWTYEFALGSLDAGLPTLVTCHDSPAAVLKHTRSVYRAVRYLMARRVFARGQHFTAVSPYLAQALQGYTDAPFAVVPNPVAQGVMQRLRPRPEPATRRVAMVCNGWDDLKNPKIGLQACAAFAVREPSTEIHLFGHGFGPEQAAQQWVASQNLQGRFSFHGPVAHARLLSELQTMDVLLHTALEESFGVVLAEAMGLGLNVVGGRDSGAVPWVLGPSLGDGLAPGLLVDVRSVDAVLQGLSQAFDSNYAQRSADGVRRVAAMFSPEVVARRYVSQYEALRSPSSSDRAGRADQHDTCAS